VKKARALRPSPNAREGRMHRTKQRSNFFVAKLSSIGRHELNGKHHREHYRSNPMIGLQSAE
jgi:hypothetical protein